MSGGWRLVEGLISHVKCLEPRVSWTEDLATPGHNTALGSAVAIRALGADETGRCCQELVRNIEIPLLGRYLFVFSIDWLSRYFC